MLKKISRIICLAGASSAIFPMSKADDLKFNRDIRPILSQNCFQCHGPDSKSRKAGLRLDQFEAAIADHKGVRAIVPGKPGSSELIARIFHAEPDEKMPPPESKLTLSDAQKETLKQWISQGARYEMHWAYIKPARPEAPKRKYEGGTHNNIDRFIVSKLKDHGLKPMPGADRHALIRRLSIDLTGLPPTPEEADAFAADKSPKAYETLIDRLLDSDSYGEHWARMWLDLARYADSAGYADDQPRTIWGYRDWVIRAFNSNMPFDQFTIQQIAGDLLPEPTNDQLTATAFHRNTQTNNEGGTNDEEFRNAAIVDRVNTTMAVWMGTTMACAQCHDHKFDPISQEEYFRLFAILNNSQDADRRDESPSLRVMSEQKKKELAARVEQIQKKIDGIKALNNKDFQPWIDGFAASAKTIPAKFEKTGDNEFSVPLPEGAFEGVFLKTGHHASPDAALRLDRPDGKPGQDGRHVRITNIVNGGYLHLAEVQVFSGSENLATKGKASQVSTGFGGPANYANDGNTNGNYTGKSVSHTAQANDPWWEIDLGKEVPVSQIAIWNRTDNGTAARMKKFRIEIFDNEHKPVWKREISKTPNPFHKETLDSATILAGIPYPRPGEHGWFQLNKPVQKKEKMILRIRAKTFATHPPKEIHFIPKLPSRLEAELPKNVFALLAIPAGQRTKDQVAKINAHRLANLPEVKAAEKELNNAAESARNMKPITTVPIMRELAEGKRRKTHIQVRGNFLQKEKEVTAGLPAVFHKGVENPSRLALANWLVSPENPLTARVVANRYWEALFGTGIVASSEEFGSQGELPSHPELLDWLATELMRVDWDLKKFIKIIVSSNTYRQDSRLEPSRLEADPFNRFLSRGPRQRLTAEMVRDQALFASGLLSRKMYGPPIKPPQPNMGLKSAFGPGLDWQTSKGEDKFRRGIYVHWRRTNPYPSMAVFDAPNRFVCNVRRTPTNTPLQALVTLNDPVYVESAQALARRMVKEGGDTPGSRIHRGFRLGLTRAPKPIETMELLKLLGKAREVYKQDAAAAKSMATVPIGPVPAGMDTTELAALTVTANIILNLDEVFQKR